MDQIDDVAMRSTTISSECVLEVSAGTNDRILEGDAVFRLRDLGSTAMDVAIDRFGTRTEIEDAREIEIRFLGEYEAYTLAAALSWAGQELHRQIGEREGNARGESSLFGGIGRVNVVEDER